MNRSRKERSRHNRRLSLLIALVSIHWTPALSSSAPPPPSTSRTHLNLQRNVSPPPPPPPRKQASQIDKQVRSQHARPPLRHKNLPNYASSPSQTSPSADLEKRRSPPPPPPRSHRKPTEADASTERQAASAASKQDSSLEITPTPPAKPSVESTHKSSTLESKTTTSSAIIPPPPPRSTKNTSSNQSTTESEQQTSKLTVETAIENEKIRPEQPPDPPTWLEESASASTPPTQEEKASIVVEVASDPSSSETTPKPLTTELSERPAKKPPLPPQIGDLRSRPVSTRPMEDTAKETQITSQVHETGEAKRRKPPPPPPPSLPKRQVQSAEPRAETLKHDTTLLSKERRDGPGKLPPPPPPPARAEQEAIHRTDTPPMKESTESKPKSRDEGMDDPFDFLSSYTKVEATLLQTEEESSASKPESEGDEQQASESKEVDASSQDEKSTPLQSEIEAKSAPSNKSVLPTESNSLLDAFSASPNDSTSVPKSGEIGAQSNATTPCERAGMSSDSRQKEATELPGHQYRKISPPPPPPPPKGSVIPPKAEPPREYEPKAEDLTPNPAFPYPKPAGEKQKPFSSASELRKPQQNNLPVSMRRESIDQQPSSNQEFASRRPIPLPPGKRYGSPSGHPRRSTPGQSAPVIRSFWSKVEKGLDGLANLEDAITGRAQKLVSKTINKSAPEIQPPRQPPPRQHRPHRPHRPQYTTQPLLGPQLRWQQQQERQQASQCASKQDPRTTGKTAGYSTAPSITLHPFKENTSMRGVDSAAGSSTTRQAGKNGQNESLSARKIIQLMPANGGASDPKDGSPWTPGGNRFSANTSPPSNQANAQPSVDNSANAGSEGTPVMPRPAPSTAGQQSGSGLPVPQQRWPPAGSPPGPSHPAPQPGRDASWSQAQTMNRGQASSQGMSRASPRPITRPTTYPDDDDDDKPSLISRVFGAIPVPPVGKLFRFRRGRMDDAYAFDAWDAEEEESNRRGGLFGLFRRQEKSKTEVAAKQVKQPSSNLAVPKPVQSLLERCDEGKTASLLRPEDRRKVRRIGKSRAILDVGALTFVLVAIRQLQGLEMIPFPTSLGELGSLTLPNLFSCLLASLDSWAPLAFAAAILAVVTNSLLFDGRIQKVASDVATAAQNEASYARLFVRLILSTPTERDISEKIARAARIQVLALADVSRLRSFVTYSVSIIILMTVAFVRPFILTALGSLIHLVTLPELRNRPLPTHHILSNFKDTIGGLGRDLKSMVEVELRGVGHNPMQVAFKASILAALVAVAYLPALEATRKVERSDAVDTENTDDAVQIMSERLDNLGASSASRLGILSKAGYVESMIERWHLMSEELSAAENDISVRILFRRLGYCITSWCLLAAPILLFGFFFDTPMTGWSGARMPRWESLLEVSVLLLFTNDRLWKTIAKVVESTSMRSACAGFLSAVSRASTEAMRSTGAQQRLSSGPTHPTAGLLVKDLWAAHEVKRAWAIRAAHLSCRAGEVVVVLADDGGGKTKLLTTIAESIVSPPKEALTARIQRGSVSLCGIDVTKWDRNLLRKRVGLFLNDINAMSNVAGLWSGLSLEEILEPGDELKVSDPTHPTGSMEKSCMIRALKITGLYWTLLPRLPTKLSSVVTANEEDLRPSAIRPRCHVLSPAEWSKLMLAKLLAQALYDNESTSGSSEQIDGSLVGSLFLLDDATMLLSEIEEAKLLQDLKRAGAATVLSSNKWATGRLADRIVVMKDGTVIESGTHNELLSRGPQMSLYAAKWQALTSF